LKEADTPWSNTLTAHEAIKLATGFVEPYKRKNGTWGSHPRSISSFTDGELNEYVELFYGIVSERFGIDPATLAKEASESSGVHPNAFADDRPGAGIIPAGVGAEGSPSEVIEPTTGGVPEGGGGVESTPDNPSPPEGQMSDDDWLKMVARMLVSAVGPDKKVLGRQRQSIIDTLTPKSISREAKDKANAIYNACLNTPLDKDYIAGLAGCEVSDLRPEAR
jgi:hypothetical protein